MPHTARCFLRDVTSSPKWCDTPPLALSFTLAHLCDTPFCNVSRDSCAMPHKKQARKSLARLSLQESRNVKSTAAGPLRTDNFRTSNANLLEIPRLLTDVCQTSERQVKDSSAPRCGSGPKYRWRALPLHPLGPLPPHQTGPPRPGLREHCKKSQGGWGGRGRGLGGKGFGLREGSSNWNGGWGGPFKHQLGPDPHLGAPKEDLAGSKVHVNSLERSA